MFALFLRSFFLSRVKTPRRRECSPCACCAWLGLRFAPARRPSGDVLRIAVAMLVEPGTLLLDPPPPPITKKGPGGPFRDWWRRRQSHRLMNQYVVLLNARNAPIDTPQMTSAGFLARFRQILTLFRRSPCAESLQRIGVADQGAPVEAALLCAPVARQVNPARGVRRQRRTPRVASPPPRHR